MNVIEWLHTPEGEEWSRQHYSGQYDGGNAARYSHGLFADIKYDHECYGNCGPYNAFTFVDEQIMKDIKRYGMNGIAA
jgi:hypothetical protein